MAVDDVSAGLLPQLLEDLELSLGLVLQLFIAALQEVLRCRQHHLHLHMAIVLRLMDPLQMEEKLGFMKWSILDPMFA